MEDIIQIEILDKGGHKDLKFRIKDLTESLTFDTYYFILASEPCDGIADIKKSIAKFINHWRLQVKSMQNGQTKYFPIDISDQYTGCLKIEKQDENLQIAYGWSKQEGYWLDINDPTHYFDSIEDFKTDIAHTIFVKQQDFLNSLKNLINELDPKESMEFFIANMGPGRPADYYLGYMDSSVFLDFNNCDNGRVCLVRISFDGYGCCDLGDKSEPLSAEDSEVFKRMMRNNINDQNILFEVIKKSIAINKGLLWLNALKEYYLV